VQETGNRAPRIFTPEYYAKMRELEQSSWWSAGMRDIARMLLDRGNLPAEGTMLDAGCGSGQTMSWFLESRERWRAVGFDVSSEGLPAAQAQNLAVCQASALRIPFESRSIDAIISLDVLQHLPLDSGDSIALAEFARVLVPGGTLLVRTNAQSIPRTPDDETASFRKYTAGMLRKKLGEAGFEVDVLGRCNAVPGLAEIPRELRALQNEKSGYHGILAETQRSAGVVDAIFRRWLALEGRAMIAGLPLPLGRTIFALCRVRK
jgi:ubiquinone/menaquinone biosynthesis C-methylase UbiE